eukprot:Protomagalhaensia_sp_Gyna_25__4461@NODE_408_length_3535_cov_48_735984_g314_i0_p2_GENE_NODE_408_length_3535_cov_48_735984_g314_i0NODE_408_length_3535_cov_48_735984_g314_i0_p2_ORF_typecomplete_len303_score44_23Isochorismatase/PF00857_20/3_1e11_NODE_408_length_3535_cov_48_735984_g314_i025903498
MTNLVWICDVQPRLSAHLAHGTLLKNSVVALLGQLDHDTHIVVTEQMPAKLGHTDPEVLEALKKFANVTIRGKETFSGWPCIKPLLETTKFDSMIITGAETHICIMKTLRDMAVEKPFFNKVILVDECIDSVSLLDRTVALAEIQRTFTDSVHIAHLESIGGALEAIKGSTFGGFPESDLYVGDSMSTGISMKLMEGAATTPLLKELGVAMGLTFTSESDGAATSEAYASTSPDRRITNDMKESEARNVVVTSSEASNSGQHLLTPESLIFSLLKASSDPQFKACLNLVKQFKAVALELKWE